MHDNGNAQAVEFFGVDLDKLTRIAEALHHLLPSRIVIGLSGTLGAGKTRFCRAIASAAGVEPADVTSPTFTLVQHYRGDRLIHHIDAYRLADEDEFVELGGEELLEDDAMVLVEWPERIAGCLPADALRLDIEIEPGVNGDGNGCAGGGAMPLRTLRFIGSDPAQAAILRDVAAQLIDLEMGPS